MNSEQMDKIIPAMLKMQEDLENLKKDSVNPHFKSGYASLPVIVEETRKILLKYKMFVTQVVKMEGDSPFFVTRVYHESGQFIDSVIPLKPEKNTMHSLGAAFTYLRRFCLLAIFNLAQEDNDGNDYSKEVDSFVKEIMTCESEKELSTIIDSISKIKNKLDPRELNVLKNAVNVKKDSF